MRRLAAVLAMLLVSLALPAAASAAGMISSLSVNPSMVRDGASATATVSLAFPDPEPTTVLVFSSNPDVASVPATVVVPAGAISADFTITSNAAAPPTIVQIMAAAPERLADARTCRSMPPPGRAVSSASVSVRRRPSSAGRTPPGRCASPRATHGAVVQLSSSNPALARVPAETVVSANTATGTFTVATSHGHARDDGHHHRAWFGVTRTTTITVTPGAPAAADGADHEGPRGRRACSRSRRPARTRTRSSASTRRPGSFMFDLTNKGGGRYADQRGWVFNPVQITVRSNFGGSAGANLSS